MHSLAVTPCPIFLDTVLKGAVLREKIMSSHYLQEKAMTFLNDSNHNEIAKAGEEIFLHLYRGLELESLDLLRYRKFPSQCSSWEYLRTGTHSAAYNQCCQIPFS